VNHHPKYLHKRSFFNTGPTALSGPLVSKNVPNPTVLLQMNNIIAANFKHAQNYLTLN